MKVVLSIDSIRYPLTGIGRYTYELAHQLALLPAISELLLMRNFGFTTDLPGEQDTPPRVAMDWRGMLLKNPLSRGLIRAMLPTLRGRALRRHQGAVYHGPNFYLPRHKGPSVATFHDVSVYSCAQFHPAERVRYMRGEIEDALKRATFLITPSEFVRSEVMQLFGVSADRIRATPLAGSPDFRPRDASETRSVLTPLGLTHNEYTLFVGTVEPRKNISALLDAYEGLPESMRLRWPLILAGHKGWSSETLHARLRQAEAAGWLRYLDYLPNQQLATLFAGARLFVFPSLYEGFGLPVLEAMKSGVPIVCSDRASLPEVAGPGALMFEAEDIAAQRECIVRGLEDEDWRRREVSRSLAHASQFSWERCARQTVEIYAEARRLA
ncbi:glycosyltransferase family 4 protein [Bordetella genomosp. 4]|uniref:Mannosyltransferase n=1 Tax=Bordetella genomosp. 4 TaxID=463044 RepID=A0A261TLZ1_9BORD|nr:glycosyltransferase family 1 protein [Bordetella genomosp. 4]OZI41826.1 mannosyltransferase [Bordetella genomosp. 4]OZI50050.1 mannosyltransferase [Bordetella genomosp. 4]